MANVDVHCTICSKLFQKPAGEYNRSKKLGRRHYCSLKCSGLYNVKNIPENCRGNASLLKGYKRNPQDEFSPFRYVIRHLNSKSRTGKKKSITVTKESLKQVWDNQEGICPYTGWKLSLPTNTWRKYASQDCIHASVDRIDSSKGYILGNIQYVCVIANLAKLSFSEQELLNFCKAIVSTKTKIEPTDETGDPQFKKYIHLASRRCRKSGKPIDITVKSLRALWNKQGGHCPYTGWKLDNPHNTAAWDHESCHPARASLDRIDSSKGYTNDNVQFVAAIYNYAKNKGDHATVVSFCEAVVKHKGL